MSLTELDALRDSLATEKENNKQLVIEKERVITLMTGEIEALKAGGRVLVKQPIVKHEVLRWNQTELESTIAASIRTYNSNSRFGNTISEIDKHIASYVHNFLNRNASGHMDRYNPPGTVHSPGETNIYEEMVNFQDVKSEVTRRYEEEIEESITQYKSEKALYTTAKNKLEADLTKEYEDRFEAVKEDYEKRLEEFKEKADKELKETVEEFENRIASANANIEFYKEDRETRQLEHHKQIEALHESYKPTKERLDSILKVNGYTIKKGIFGGLSLKKL